MRVPITRPSPFLLLIPLAMVVIGIRWLIYYLQLGYQAGRGGFMGAGERIKERLP